MFSAEIIRARKIIDSSISSLSLDLNGKTVLTEVGSNNYLFTPLIPALAGASEVIAWTKDTRFGQSDDIIAKCTEIAKIWGVESKITFRKNSRDWRDVSKADIITNSGMIRPISSEMVGYMKPEAVVPLMFEAWEIRESDIDVQACKLRGIKVAGTWENHPKLKVFEYTGILALKLVLNAGIEVFDSTILVWSNDHFGETAALAFETNRAKRVILTNNIEKFEEELPYLDAIFLCDYHVNQPLLGKTGLFNIELIKNINPGLSIIHLYGSVDADFVRNHDISLFPNRNGFAHVMTETLGYVGLEPILRLQVAGFAVASELESDNISDLTQII